MEESNANQHTKQTYIAYYLVMVLTALLRYINIYIYITYTYIYIYIGYGVYCTAKSHIYRYIDLHTVYHDEAERHST